MAGHEIDSGRKKKVWLSTNICAIRTVHVVLVFVTTVIAFDQYLAPFNLVNVCVQVQLDSFWFVCSSIFHHVCNGKAGHYEQYLGDLSCNAHWLIICFSSNNHH
jgi:hypothetical protein